MTRVGIKVECRPENVESGPESGKELVDEVRFSDCAALVEG